MSKIESKEQIIHDIDFDTDEGVGNLKKLTHHLLECCHMLVLREVWIPRALVTPSLESPPWYIWCDPKNMVI